MYLVVFASSCSVASLLYAATPAEIARAEYDQVMTLEPNLENGRATYLTCAVCHRPEGWGTLDGSHPQIAGQHRTVIIKQLADIRARTRDNPLMYPFSVPGTLGGLQQIADVAAYVSQLPMTPYNGVGHGTDLELGKRLYEDGCAECHGKDGEGDSEEHVPAIAGQHYNYLVREFDLIRFKLRNNADPDMVKHVEDFPAHEEAAVLDYASRLRPPADKLAPSDWLNPDFPYYVRPPEPEPLPVAPMPEPPPLPPIVEFPAMPAFPDPPAMRFRRERFSPPEPPPEPPMRQWPQ